MTLLQNSFHTHRKEATGYRGEGAGLRVQNELVRAWLKHSQPCAMNDVRVEEGQCGFPDAALFFLPKQRDSQTLRAVCTYL